MHLGPKQRRRLPKARQGTVYYQNLSNLLLNSNTKFLTILCQKYAQFKANQTFWGAFEVILKYTEQTLEITYANVCIGAQPIPNKVFDAHNVIFLQIDVPGDIVPFGSQFSKAG